MLKNYIKIALRNLARFKIYTMINILGLAVGLSCCILILLFIRDEMSYDKFHRNGDNIYRVVEMNSQDGEAHYHDGTPAPLGPALKNEFPEVFKVTRLTRSYEDVITYGDFQTNDNRCALADPNIFEVFTIPLSKGEPQSALNDRNSVVISENLAEKYFGNKDPMGKILQIGQGNYKVDYKVTGVFKNLPHNSTLQFDCLSSFENIYIEGNEGSVSWGAQNYETYVLLHENYSRNLLESKLSRIVEKYKSEIEDSKTKYLLQNLNDIHLCLEPGYDFPTERDSTHILIFVGIAILILMAACINFMNLATAHASMREKEVGIRKIAGAGRLELIKQFLSESIILSLLAFLLSIPFVELVLPVFNEYIDKELSFLQYGNILFLFSLLIFALFVGVLSGFYPALFISSFKPTAVIKGRLFGDKVNTRAGLRRILVIFQFVIAIIFVACTLIMHNQLQYIKDKNLGYNKEHLVIIPISDQKIKPKYNLYKTEILRNPNILNASAAYYSPSDQGLCQNVHFKEPYEGIINYIDWMTVDYDFIETMGLKLTMGRNFSEDYPSDTVSAYILNESALKQLGWKNPLGQQMNLIGWGPVIGVIKDFHFKSLHQSIRPMALCIYRDAYKHLLIRVKPEDLSGSINYLENQWQEIFPGKTFEYSFFDEEFDKLYKTDIRLTNVFNFITALALFVGCLGLLGLVHFSTERKSKEIGIRKVMGASVINILVMTTKEYFRWIIISNIIAVPVAYYIVNKWLEDFAYRIEISWWMFALAGGISLVIALATVSFQVIRAAMANPIESLRYE